MKNNYHRNLRGLTKAQKLVTIDLQISEIQQDDLLALELDLLDRGVDRATITRRLEEHPEYLADLKDDLMPKIRAIFERHC